jgi:hypothetical protein
MSRPGSLSSSLMTELRRFSDHGRKTETLEVVAACIRHAQSALLHLQFGDKVVPLTAFSQERLVHCPMDMDMFLELPLHQAVVMHIEPALLRPPGDREPSLVAELCHYYPLSPLMWELALRTRDDLLPEIGGPAAYRVSPSFDLEGLRFSDTLRAAIDRLRRQTSSLRSISGWSGLNRLSATRLLNALYLQAGLMITRSHPDAMSESWFRR